MIVDVKENTLQYENLTSSNLSGLTEQFVTRLPLFNKEYPNWIPHAVRAIMEHPNLNQSDRSTLETFCTLFELDWRGD
jgi:hypothetical protein